jgi:hypothetical protein
MSNPTSNFNWQMPTATDLVTDLPADFEVFGQAVDSSMADLLGGTTGQILAKNSNTNMDFVWITNDVGDITAVTAGTGISGGGTSGAVTITNSMATEIAAKGDLIVGTGSQTFDNVTIGANGTVLTADSTEATGVKWATPSSTPSFVGCRLTKSADQAIGSNALTAITFNVETFDTDGFHDNATNNTRITIPTGKSGKYSVIARFSWDTTTTTYKYWRIRKNQTNILTFGVADGTALEYVQIADILDLTAGDYIEFECYQNSGGNVTLYSNAFEPGTTVFGVQYLGA